MLFLIIIYIGIDLFGFIMFGTLFAYCTWISVSFFRFGNFSAIISSNTIFNPPFLLFSFCQTLYYLTGLLYYFHFFFHLVFCLLFLLGNFYYSIFSITYSSLIHSSALFILLFIAFSSAFILVNEFSSF